MRAHSDTPAASDDLGPALGRAVHSARSEQGLSISGLATSSGVSRAMIARIEGGDVQPTAALLARLSASLGLTLSELIARAESDGTRLRRAAEQPVWTDPESGYSRRALSPSTGAAIELIEVTLPPGASVDYPAEAYRHITQQIWVMSGTLRFREGADVHELRSGDCLQLGEPAHCAFESAGPSECRYIVALAKTAHPRR
ncbi:XRE family transcriptional regulator [Microbacterium sp. cx-55]|uniref:helix-turn-helix domain-containing protein n=1 Tax=Microbacterium sp. cx-55 TaxID=2875948 RepID=UPI001CBEBF9F|nr:XRE family transcriptional regulator [Microbacterium sp. cx-55]MBZ4486083.1 XRE family transcriptional regulator [Microbacterium sp. cx-55]UGB34046.1 XRE family transcriptional regulator [Microbacterium sp. cx-55]